MTENKQCEPNIRDITYRVDLDISLGLKALKALSRHALKAADSLKKLEKQHRQLDDLQEGEGNA